MERGVITGGFERKQYSERVEQAFDQAFAYEPPLVETFRYAHTMQHGTPEECASLRVQAIRGQHIVVQQPSEQRQPTLTPAQESTPAIQELHQYQPSIVIEQSQAIEQKRTRGPVL